VNNADLLAVIRQNPGRTAAREESGCVRPGKVISHTIVFSPSVLCWLGVPAELRGYSGLILAPPACASSYSNWEPGLCKLPSVRLAHNSAAVFIIYNRHIPSCRICSLTADPQLHVNTGSLCASRWVGESGCLMILAGGFSVMGAAGNRATPAKNAGIGATCLCDHGGLHPCTPHPQHCSRKRLSRHHPEHPVQPIAYTHTRASR